MTRFRFVSQETTKLGRSDARWQANNDYRVNKGLAEQCVESCLATLSTMDSKAYKKVLQDKLKEWYNLHAAVRPTPKAGRLSVASLGYGDEPQRRGMKGRRGEFGENSLRCNELLPPEIRSRIGPARTRKMRFIYMISLLIS